MSNPPVNPYAAPTTQSDLQMHPGLDGPLASLGDRFVGAFIDGIILLLVIVPASIVIGIAVAAAGMSADSWAFSLLTTLIGLPVMAVAFLVINGHLLASRGQTVGKYLIKTQIVGDDGKIQPLMPLFFKRYLSVWLLSSIPIIGGFISLIDALLVFRGSRKCLHDDIAGTHVIKLSS